MTHNDLDKAAIRRDLLALLADLTGGWGRALEAPIGPETRLVADLDFESIDIVQLVTALEEHYGRPRLPFEKLLMKDGRYVDELAAGDVIDFLHQYLPRT
ncbi:MAG: phosphopantetheine-binding protein [Thermoguttaceae bacterium]|jgi:acyl carrier protein